jgi:hypothetical protein
MGKASDSQETISNHSKPVFLILPLAAAVVYFFTNPKPQNYYDYTFRVAANLLRGAIGFKFPQPSWLNEFVPFEGFYYSVFPLGAVLSMLPFAALQAMGVFRDMPGAFIAAILAGVSCFYLLKIAERYDVSEAKKNLLTLAILFGTWTWTNLTFDGAWQLALGFAMVGELGAIYYTVFDRKPLLAGAFFALAFGNRTEILLTAPISFFLIDREDGETQSEAGVTRKTTGKGGKDRNLRPTAFSSLRVSAVSFQLLAKFCAIPFLLGIATLSYNYLRFHSFTDFGYDRIPGVLTEPWYNHGIFSLYYIPRQAWEMLWKTWRFLNAFPYLVPDGFSSSILWSSPFLLFVLRPGSRDKVLKYTSWTAVVILTFLLWIHGNSGGWQFGYRYAMILLPWLFVILLESSPKKITPLEWAAYSFSFAMNAYATWLFHWTDYVKP